MRIVTCLERKKMTNVTVRSFVGNEIEFDLNGPKVKRNNPRMSTRLFWQGRGKGTNGTQNGRSWVHTSDTLLKGHVVYLVKFLGMTPVTEPKGIEVVQEAIKKLQFTQQLKKSENKDGAKCKKVELTISVDGVAIQEPKTSNIMHQFPLHRISYCADDKGEKKYFSFIAKPGFPVGDIINPEDCADEEDKYECFVFTSTKLASEITLTIGQAFDLAYRRFMTDNSKMLEIKKLTLQNKKLTLQMSAYKKRLQDLSKITYKDDMVSYLTKSNLTDITEYQVPEDLLHQLKDLRENQMNGTSHDLGESREDSTEFVNNQSQGKLQNLMMNTPKATHNGKQNGIVGKQKEQNNLMMKDISPSKNPVVGTKLEGLLLESDSDSDFDPRASESETPAHLVSHSFPPSQPMEYISSPPPLLAPPPKASKRQPQPTPNHTMNGNDPFGSTPFTMPSHTIQPQPSLSVSPLQAQTTATPNYDISDFNLQTSVFNSSASFTNGLTGYDPFETPMDGSIYGNGFGNAFGNAFSGLRNLSDKQTVQLDSNFNGFLTKTITEMKDGFSRGITFGNDDFSIENLDPLKKN